MHLNEPIVKLWQAGGIGLILLHGSGVFYTNQTGGHACSHPEAEGTYVPLHDELLRQQKLLREHFTGPKWGGWCTDGIDEETAVFIDEVLARSPYTDMLRVDRGRHEESHEAWIYVRIEVAEGEAGRLLWQGLAVRDGVLTWENSD